MGYVILALYIICVLVCLYFEVQDKTHSYVFSILFSLAFPFLLPIHMISEYRMFLKRKYGTKQ